MTHHPHVSATDRLAFTPQDWHPRCSPLAPYVPCRSRFQSSTKIEALREELDVMRRRDPGAKAIVFSQFTSMLELIGFRLEQVGGQ